MKSFRISRSSLSRVSIPCIYLGIWLLGVVLLFLYGVQTNTIWMTADIVLPAPQKLEAPRDHPMLAARQEKARQEEFARQQAEREQAQRQAQQKTQATKPATGSAVQPVRKARTGRPVIGAPRIEAQKDAFGVSFDLGRDPSGEISIARQEKVAAWMISLPGQWVMTGPAYIETDHPLVSSMLVLINNNRAKIKIFYRNPQQKEGQPPRVTLTDSGVHILLVD